MAIIALVALLAVCLSCTGGDALPVHFERIDERRIRHTPSDIVLVRIDPGRLWMGSPDDEYRRDRDEVLHEVRIEAPYYLAETEVTGGQWHRVMGSEGPERAETPEHPIGGVTWHRAQQFAATLAEDTPGFRLPSEAEWEYACRAGTRTPFAFGADVDPSQVHYDASDPYRDGERGRRPEGPRPARSLPANAWGLYEMHGNLWEWVADAYRFDASAPALEAPMPGGPRVMRGGGYTRGAFAARCAYRDGYPPSSHDGKYGVRVAWSRP